MLIMNRNGRSRHHSRAALILGASTFLTAAVAEAQITRIVIDPARSESPTFEGRLFGTNGSIGPTKSFAAPLTVSSILPTRATR